MLGCILAPVVQSILKSRDITLPTKVRLVKAMVFPVVMYGCESWTIKKAECQRIDAFDLCCWRRLLRVPWTARRSNQSILKEIILNIHWKDWCWSWSSNTLATWCKELTHWKRLWYWERLRAGGEGGDRGWDGWMASPTQWTWVWVNSGRQWRTGRPDMLQSMGLQRVRHESRHEWVAEKQQKLVPKLFGIRDQFHGRQFFDRWGGEMVWGWFKSMTFIVHFIPISITSASPQIIKH